MASGPGTGRGGPPPPGRRERRKREVRQRILEASVALFDERGVEATTVGAICERADVAHKTFFNHFASRRHLLRAIAHEALEETLARIEAATKRPVPTAERLQRFFRDVAEAALEAGPMHRELLTEIIHASQEDREGEPARRLHEAFGRLVREGLAAGEVDPRHGEEVLTEMVTGAFYTLMLSFAHMDDYPLRRRAEGLAAFLGDALAPQPARRRR
jgi:AcrR family transcriptional regulator